MTPDALKHLIGMKGRPQVYEVTRVDIRKIADAAGDRNPLYWDDEYARASRFGGMIAPPDFFGWPVRWEPNLTFVNSSDLGPVMFAELAKAGYTRAINAGMESEFYRPVRPGDTLVLTGEIVAIEEKEGKKGGKMLLSTIEITIVNQNGDLVARQRHNGIH
jgi:acyl dehydratase